VGGDRPVHLARPEGEEHCPFETKEELLMQFTGRPLQILSLYLPGYAHHEISSQMGSTERAVYRPYERVKEWLRWRSVPPLRLLGG
jgi:hypothetical protein